MKNKQIIMLALVFVVSGVCGWFLESFILGDRSKIQDAEIVAQVEEEPVVILSTVPVIDVETILLEGTNGKYDLTVSASVESGDPLTYALYLDELCQEKEVVRVADGKFKDIPGTDGKTYYLQVQNTNTSETSDIIAVEGFVKAIRYQKVTKEELEDLFNRYKSWSKAPAEMTAKMEKSVLRNLQVDVVNKDPEEEYIPNTLREICQYVNAGTWKRVNVLGELSYDGQGRLKKLKIEVER